jgi:pyruvate/2-oxoglutarate dehydrogenase complex dihydrolipoamide acyltransferase (E2) component
MVRSRHTLSLPDLEVGDVAIVASVWHVGVGGEVSCGESILEILAGDVVIDLPAPVNGVLINRLVAEDEPLVRGQPLAVIASDSRDPS